MTETRRDEDLGLDFQANALFVDHLPTPKAFAPNHIFSKNRPQTVVKNGTENKNAEI